MCLWRRGGGRKESGEVAAGRGGAGVVKRQALKVL